MGVGIRSENIFLCHGNGGWDKLEKYILVTVMGVAIRSREVPGIEIGKCTGEVTGVSGYWKRDG